MRIFQFWSILETTIQVDGQAQKVRCHGGSNHSIEAAQRDAQQRLEHVSQKIAGQLPKNEEYEVDIREEVLARLDDRNIVTRNRYGAEILNSADLMFVDMDEPQRSFWDLFRGRAANPKDRIVEFVKRRATAPDFRSLGIRLYETNKGIRAIITGQAFDPKSRAALKLMQSLNADPLYASLCKRQACFRARLTPKPYRIKSPTIRVNFPRTTPEEEATLSGWIPEYDRVRAAFSTCKFLCTIGLDHSSPVIKYHDKATGAFSGHKLA